ncbi:MAG: homocysteine S-methyltransferase family protein [Lachnospiraceae bacterium]|nr:homocysteine S-methyltransferase family protein [Lachnospiraceae bacterium]
MNAREFAAFAENRIRFLDGATGTNLMKAGMPVGVCPEMWILKHPEAILSLQRAYAEAGSDIVYAPTFTGNRIKLKEYGLDKEIGRINTELVALSRQAVEGFPTLVAGDLTMTGRQVAPIGDLEFDELVDVYREQIRYLRDAGADLLVVETMMSLQETRAALIAAKEEAPELAVMATLTFEADGRTLFGTNAAAGAVVLESLGACAVGANCSTGPSEMKRIIASMAGVTRIPIIAKPNAGFPVTDRNGNTYYDMEPGEYAEAMTELVDAGAQIIGACCGSTPDFIRAARERFADYDVQSCPAVRRQEGIRTLASERRALTFAMDAPFMIVGERINPTGKKKLQAELREGKLDLVCQYAIEQETAGASVLDVNVGMPGIDEHEMMRQVLHEVTSLTDLPLCLDSSDFDTMEDALRHYPGRALINSISLEKGKAERFLPLAKKYGAMFILLPVGEDGIPNNFSEKIDNIVRLWDKARKLGFCKEDIVVDGLVATIGADPQAAVSVLDTVDWCREHDLATICGLSNISFGLPERGYINTAFLTMAIDRGLTMAIANPSQELLVNAAFASDLLKVKEGSDSRYIERMRRYEGTGAPGLAPVPGNGGAATPVVTKTAPAQEKKLTPAELVHEDVMLGNRRNIKADTEAAIKDGTAPEILLNDHLMTAINEVGALFNQGKYFLPQLIGSAEAMKLSISVLEPLLAESGAGREELPAIVFATVQGDVHDIGKNLVVLMLKNVGFTVYDLGKDVPKEEIVQAAINHDAKIIGLSALMTTTMQEMRHVVKLARERVPDVKIMIGGAVVTQEFADEIGADAYTKDAAEAVRMAKKLVGMEEV